MWYLIVSIPDLCTLTYFKEHKGTYLHFGQHLPFVTIRIRANASTLMNPVGLEVYILSIHVPCVSEQSRLCKYAGSIEPSFIDKVCWLALLYIVDIDIFTQYFFVNQIYNLLN